MGISGSNRNGDPGAANACSIGVFGGTFDPIHHGHLRIALDALETLRLQQVRFVPLAQAVHREQPDAPADLRLQMLQAALDGRQDLIADDRELQRKGPSYTIDTLRSLREDFPEARLCLLLGDDAFGGFAAWRNPRGILGLANIAVLRRPNQASPSDPALAELLAEHWVKDLAGDRPGQIVFCSVTQLDIASSDIRQRIASGRSADFLAPPAVLELIAQYGLYCVKTPADGL
jgi:nicotinate-nucleotide adenylyltransferase